MKKRELTCIVCPRGCQLKVELDDKGVPVNVSGNLCPRGKVYANDECTNPQRMVTSTVRCEDGSVVSCKTSVSVSKSLVFDIMKAINKAKAPNDIKIGDCIIKNVVGSGADIIATSGRD